MLTKNLKKTPSLLRSRAFLRIVADPENITSYEILNHVHIGRGESNAITIDDPFISTVHASVRKTPRGFFLEDLASRDGIFVNGVCVRSAWLNEGDHIRIGHTELGFSFEAHWQPQHSLELSSKNAEWNAKLRLLPMAALSPLPVLILGPSGAGKENIARALHRYSKRRAGPFITVNCSALSASLVESELFGHLKGSFTDANSGRRGAFEAARGGTLFLDEIGDLPLSMQPKLLRALENTEIKPVGSDKTIQTDVRIVAATHKNLKHLVACGEFREDLFYRLNVLNFELPALTERLEDFEDLFFQFCEKVGLRYTTEALERLKAHPWPGNIRELKNFTMRAQAFLPNKLIRAEALNQLLEPDGTTVNFSEKSIPQSGVQKSKSFRHSQPIIKKIERELIVKQLVFHNGNQRRAAMSLGMPKSTLHDRIRKYGINIKQLIKTHSVSASG